LRQQTNGRLGAANRRDLADLTACGTSLSQIVKAVHPILADQFFQILAKNALRAIQIVTLESLPRDQSFAKNIHALRFEIVEAGPSRSPLR
jgi:hypothetical protein